MWEITEKKRKKTQAIKIGICWEKIQLKSRISYFIVWLDNCWNAVQSRRIGTILQMQKHNNNTNSFAN